MPNDMIDLHVLKYFLRILPSFPSILSGKLTKFYPFNESSPKLPPTGILGHVCTFKTLSALSLRN